MGGNADLSEMLYEHGAVPDGVHQPRAGLSDRDVKSVRGLPPQLFADDRNFEGGAEERLLDHASDVELTEVPALCTLCTQILFNPRMRIRGGTHVEYSVLNRLVDFLRPFIPTQAVGSSRNLLGTTPENWK